LNKNWSVSLAYIDHVTWNFFCRLLSFFFVDLFCSDRPESRDTYAHVIEVKSAFYAGRLRRVFNEYLEQME